MKLSIRPEIEINKLSDEDWAYLQLLGIVTGTSPFQEDRLVIIAGLKDRGEPTHDFEFVGFRKFEIEGVKS
jgi:hypothetical protein